ncbi:MAG: hypothetical protein SFU85_13080 [Candidatus Methylacidiphilales bacterium]|nr:hypothetical protein [Candidatus Methylacidiphilales bacterium]
MKSIDRIIVLCCKRDFWLTRICVASIRYWYPEIPIGIIKDVSLGDFDTREMEGYWDVSVAAVPDPPRGYFTKLEAFYFPGRERILLLDSDIIFLGRVLEKLERHDEDFVVNWGGTKPLSAEKKKQYALDGYYNPEKLRNVLPDFELPDFFFNAGQMVLTSSLLVRGEVETWLMGTPPLQTARFPEALTHLDQSLLNLLLVQMQRRGECTLGLCDFVRWSIHREMVWDIELDRIRNRQGYPALIHWAGVKTFHKSGFIRGDLLGFYEDLYYGRISSGELKRNIRLIRRARGGSISRSARIMALLHKKIDFRKLLENERRPTREANPFAFVVSEK